MEIEVNANLLLGIEVESNLSVGINVEEIKPTIM
jgi:hypothetical protein